MMPSGLFMEWVAYARIEPFGDQRADLRAGVLASLTANANRGKRGKSYQPGDFFPELKDGFSGSSGRVSDPRAIWQGFKDWAQSFRPSPPGPSPWKGEGRIG